MAPATAVNQSADVLNVRRGLLEASTVRVTLAVWVPEPDEKETDPVHTVPAAIPEWLTAIVNTVAVGEALKPPDGDKMSHELVVQLCSVACAVAAVAVGADTLNDCAGGAAAPAVAVKLKAERLSVRGVVAGAATFIVTPTD